MHEMLQKTQVQQSNTSVQCIYIEKECKVAQWNEKKCSVSMFHRRTFKPSGREKGTLLTSACPVSTWLCLTQRKIKLLLGVCVCEAELETCERKGIRKGRGLWHHLQHEAALEMQWDHLLPGVGRWRARSSNFIKVSARLQPLTTLLSTTKDKNKKMNGGLFSAVAPHWCHFNSAFANICLFSLFLHTREQG